MRPIPALLLVLATAACGRGDAREGTDSAAPAAAPRADSRAALPAAAAVALDSGNAAFRAGRFDVALTAYRDAAAKAPDHAAPYYGLYMAARATKNVALADSALAAVRARTPDADAEVDSALATSHGDPAGATPALPHGHPVVAPKTLPPGHPAVAPRPAPKPSAPAGPTGS